MGDVVGGEETVPVTSAEGGCGLPEATAASAATAPCRPRARWGLLAQWAVVASFIALLLYLHVAVVRVAYVPSQSMEPTLKAGDRLLVRKDAYRSRPPQRGEVVVFRTADGYEVKRVIAVAGDRIGTGWGQVWLNDQQLEEPYLKEPMIWERPVGPVQVPDGQVFVMGDNRNHSEDSRDDGSVAIVTILGRATRILLPLDRAGTID